MLCAFAGPLYPNAAPLDTNAGPLSPVLTMPRPLVSTTLRRNRRRAVGRGRAVAFAERLHEGDERTPGESCGHDEFARTRVPQ
jgi:hypothetical protein